MRIFDENNKYDYIDLLESNSTLEELKTKIFNFYHSEKYLTACGFCLGRGELIHGKPKLDAAVQTKKYLSIRKFTA